ncbi:MAG: cyclodeaminase/cyclohydrolase family protein, partial [Nitriliruptorales bacterium]
MKASAPRPGPGEPRYVRQPLDELLEAFAAREPAPGGGVAAVVTVALGAALTAMAARFSEEHTPDAAAVARDADALRARVLPLADEDAAAYGEVLA